jgi:hypothetical protein
VVPPTPKPDGGLGDLREDVLDAALEAGKVTAEADARPTTRIWFRIEEKDFSWLPIRDSPLLLWVLAFLIGVWFAIGWLLGAL